MPSVNVKTIKCPRCRQVQPEDASHCDFCHAQIAPEKEMRFTKADETALAPRSQPDALTWTECGYVMCSTLIALSGAYLVLRSFGVIDAGNPQGGVSFVVGAISVWVAAALIMAQFWAQSLVKWLCIGATAYVLSSLLKGLSQSSVPHPFALSEAMGPIFEAGALSCVVYIVASCGAYPHKVGQKLRSK